MKPELYIPPIHSRAEEIASLAWDVRCLLKRQGEFYLKFTVEQDDDVKDLL